MESEKANLNKEKSHDSARSGVGKSFIYSLAFY